MQRITKSLSILMLSVIPAIAVAQDNELQNRIVDIQTEWAHIHYQVPIEKQDVAFPHLEDTTQTLIKQYPEHAEPLVWAAIVLSTHAGAKGGIGALSLINKARSLLEQAEKIDPGALDGSIYTTLGSLYYQAPGWPLSFGDDKKAEALLQKAIAIDPTGIDSNYFYGDFLYRKGRYSESRAHLIKALQAPSRPNRALADSGRRQEAQSIIEKLDTKT